MARAAVTRSPVVERQSSSGWSDEDEEDVSMDMLVKARDEEEEPTAADQDDDPWSGFDINSVPMFSSMPVDMSALEHEEPEQTTPEADDVIRTTSTHKSKSKKDKRSSKDKAAKNDDAPSAKRRQKRKAAEAIDDSGAEDDAAAAADQQVTQELDDLSPYKSVSAKHLSKKRQQTFQGTRANGASGHKTHFPATSAGNARREPVSAESKASKRRRIEDISPESSIHQPTAVTDDENLSNSQAIPRSGSANVVGRPGVPDGKHAPNGAVANRTGKMGSPSSTDGSVVDGSETDASSIDLSPAASRLERTKHAGARHRELQVTSDIRKSPPQRQDEWPDNSTSDSADEDDEEDEASRSGHTSRTSSPNPSEQKMPSRSERRIEATAVSSSASKSRRNFDKIAGEARNAGGSDEARSSGSKTPKTGATRVAPERNQDTASSTRKPSRPAVEYTQGRFTAEERQRLDQAVETYRAMLGISQTELNALIHSNPKGADIKELWDTLCVSFPDRRRQHVINTTRKRFHNLAGRGKWTPEQDAELLAAYERYKDQKSPWAAIAKEINRMPIDVRDRYQGYLVCGDAQRKTTWTPQEERKLFKLVTKSARLILASRKDVDPDSWEAAINWEGVSVHMGRTRSQHQCREKWKTLRSRVTINLENLDDEDEESTDTAEPSSWRRKLIRSELEKLSNDHIEHMVRCVIASRAPVDERIPWRRILEEARRLDTTSTLSWDGLRRETLAVCWRRLRIAAALPLKLPAGGHHPDINDDDAGMDVADRVKPSDNPTTAARTILHRYRLSDTFFPGGVASFGDDDAEEEYLKRMLLPFDKRAELAALSRTDRKVPFRTRAGRSERRRKSERLAVDTDSLDYSSDHRGDGEVVARGPVHRGLERHCKASGLQAAMGVDAADEASTAAESDSGSAPAEPSNPESPRAPTLKELDDGTVKGKGTEKETRKKMPKKHKRKGKSEWQATKTIEASSSDEDIPPTLPVRSGYKASAAAAR